MYENNNIEIEEIHEADKIFYVISAFKDYFNSNVFSDEENRRKYAEKLAAHAHFIAAYYENTAVACWAIYTNNTENKRVFSPLLSVKKDLGAFSSVVLVKLLNYGWNIMKRTDLEIIRLETDKDNVKAQRLYRTLGFDYAGESSQDKIYMEASLTEAGKKLEKFSSMFNRFSGDKLDS